jgi:predicted RNA methylase
MLMKRPETLYKVMSFCRKEGYFREIKNEDSEPEAVRFEHKNIKSTGLGVLDAVRCIQDINRTNFFLSEIKKLIKKGDEVLEAGVGTGILSFAAAEQGAQVLGIELNKAILKLAKKIKDSKNLSFLKNSTHFLHKNALKFKPDQKFDFIISENIYTGMLYEKQVQIMNHLLQFLKRGGKVLPSELLSYISLCEVHTSLLQKKLPLIVVSDIKDKNLYKNLSDEALYSHLKFDRKNKEYLNETKVVKILRSGNINGLYITAQIKMPSGKMLSGSKTSFFGNDIIIPIKSTKKVKKGDKITIRISYKLGGSPKKIKILI